MVIRQGRQAPQTTDSNHRLQRYPNLLIDRPVTAPRQVWVSDITAPATRLLIYWVRLFIINNRCLFEADCGLLFASILGSGRQSKGPGYGLATHLEREEELIYHRSGAPVRPRQPIL